MMNSKRLIILLGTICLILVLMSCFLPACAAEKEPQTLKLGASLPLNVPFGYKTKKAGQGQIKE